MTDTEMTDLFARNGVHVGDPDARAALARRVSGYGVTVLEMEDVFWMFRQNKGENPAALLIHYTDKGMESFKDVVMCATKMRMDRAPRHEPNMPVRDRHGNYISDEHGRAPADHPEIIAWEEEQRKMREEYRERFGD